MSSPDYEVVVIGGGPAGLTAAMYAARAGLKTLVVDPGPPGGRLVNIDFIENYPGFPGGVAGPELGQRMFEQACSLGVEFAQWEVASVGASGEELAGGRRLLAVRGSETQVLALTTIIASGTREKKLGVPGEGEFRGRGVSYCATCDGPLFRGKDVAVVGGGDSAIAEAIFLSRICRQVYVIHRRDALRAAQVLQQRAFRTENITFLWSSAVEAMEGEDSLSSLRVKDLKSGNTRSLEVQGVFVYVGLSPNTEFARGLVDLDEAGYVFAGEETLTSRPGVFAAGDVRKKALRQVSTAVGDGAMAAMAAQKYLSEA